MIRDPNLQKFELFGGFYDFIKGDFKYKKWRTNSCESILRFSDLGRIQTCNLLSRNQVHYSVMLRGPILEMRI